ncbi:MAG: ADP-ribosylglycohydrolase family protein [Nitrospira sp.]|nr:ADP-ribosylglycohydrolase family protein [Nitrospira sp.]
MFGAVIGDIVGSRFEFDNYKHKSFDFWHQKCTFNDDTVCTVAVADILLHRRDPAATLQAWCRDYPDRGYGGWFAQWITSDAPRPYQSFGNGAAMRVSPAAFLHRTDLDAALQEAQRVTEITHDHQQGVKGALATTHAIWLALNQHAGTDIRRTIQREYGYDMSTTVDEIRPGYRYNETCQGTVPQALTCALESHSVEDAVRNAISIGGDSDTLAAIAGALGEALHGIEQGLIDTACNRYLDARIGDVLQQMYGRG